MLRFVSILLLAVALGTGLAWKLGFLTSSRGISTKETGPTTSEGRELISTVSREELGADLYRPLKLEKRFAEVARHGADPVIVAASLSVLEKMDAGPQVPGQILFVGQEIPEGAAQIGGIAPLLQGKINTALVDVGDSKHYKLFSKLTEGDIVGKEEVVALINPAKAIHGVRAAAVKLSAAEAEELSSEKIYIEAERRYATDRRLFESKVISEIDLSNSKLTATKSWGEWIAKKEAAKVARIDLTKEKLILGLHYVHNKLPVESSIIKTVFKRTGEAVKELEPILALYAVDRLTAEGLVELQFNNRLALGKKVSVEPTRESSPLRVWRSHKKEITAVAVTHTGLAASASEDGTVCLWDERYAGPVALLVNPLPVRSLACTPRDVDPKTPHLLLAGLSDGSIAVWDLDKLNVGDDGTSKPPQPIKILKEKDQHGDAVTALAFSPKGRFFASGSTDGSIILWDTHSADSNYFLFALDAAHGVASPHSGQVTALHFTPQSTLVSAGRDNTLRVWELHEKGVALRTAPIAGRGGNINALGVSRDGSTILFDQGRTLQFLTPEGRTVATLQNPAGTVPFETLAEFSPDATLLLTAGAAEGRLQLWKAPTDGKRGYELRQFVTSERAGITCAAFFDPAVESEIPPYAVSGTKDGIVYLWPLPSRGDVRNYRIDNMLLSQISNNVETRQIRIGVELPNDGKLMPGQPVTIVIE